MAPQRKIYVLDTATKATAQIDQCLSILELDFDLIYFYHVNTLLLSFPNSLPQLILCHVHQDPNQTLATLRLLRIRFPRVPICILVHQIDAPTLREFLIVGIIGCIMLSTPCQEIRLMVATMLAGKLVLPKTTTASLIG